MIKTGKLTEQKLAELGMQAEAEKNKLEEIVYALAVAGQHEYAEAYFRNQSLDGLSVIQRVGSRFMLLPAALLKVLMGTIRVGWISMVWWRRVCERRECMRRFLCFVKLRLPLIELSMAMLRL